MKNKLVSWILFLSFIFILWLGFSIFFNNPFILPSPLKVFNTMSVFLADTSFYIASISTIVRVIVSIIISFIFGFITSFICAHNRIIYDFFSKFLLIIRTLPNVTIIILLLFWIPRELTVLVVSFLLLFPIIHEELYNTITLIDISYRDLFIIYDQSLFTKFKYVYLPLLKAPISSSLISTGTLCFKVIVMAEILGQVSKGIGRQIQISRLNVELHEVIAWTIWIIIFVFIFNYCYKKIINYIFK